MAWLENPELSEWEEMALEPSPLHPVVQLVPSFVCLVYFMYWGEYVYAEYGRPWRSEAGGLKLELWMVVSHPVWVLGTNL